MTQWIYGFGNGTADGRGHMKNLLGGKGAGLAEMSHLGLPVPPGFTITTEACTWFYQNNQRFPQELAAQLKTALTKIEQQLGATLGDAHNPLLVSVRSGARASMPGMMDTVLNLGLNSETVEGLAKRSANPRFAYDSYRRFIHMFAGVVLGVPHAPFEEALDDMKRHAGYRSDTDMTAENWKEIIGEYLQIVKKETGKDFPQNVDDQLWAAVGAVFKSWMNPRAVTYRNLHDLPHDWGTAVTVQAMVFGNMGNDCCTGVAFTRNPSTGENAFYGEYLVNAQGEDVVAGLRTPNPITLKAKAEMKATEPAMEEVMPAVFQQLCAVRQQLEKHYKDMQDIEFTVQQGKLYLLQTRSGKRTAPAALRIAVEMVEEGLISQNEAVLRIEPKSLDQLLHPTLDPKAKRTVLTKGLPASPGAASGQVVFTADRAEELAHKGVAVILCRTETSPEDIHGMHAAKGILTSRGGMTSHAAVVARGMGRCCVVGAGDMVMDEYAGTMNIKGTTLKEGDIITLDGSTGEVMMGDVPRVQPALTGHFATLMGWADRLRTLRVRANAETPRDAETARRFGAEGIGLCRTEHMFFDAERISAMREMIVAKDQPSRVAALEKLAPFQTKDFAELFAIMDGLPVTIRLLDPPLHEFLPKSENEMAEVARLAGVTVAYVRQRVHELHESNPMLGHRGCRLGISFPEIYEMQVQAIARGALQAVAHGHTVLPEIMLPLIATEQEMNLLKQMVDKVMTAEMMAAGKTIDYWVGTMIELPRAALRAADLAKHAQFFSFGTNDLTQTTLGISRDDAGMFLADYQRANIFPHDPFASLDTEGVGELIRMAAERGRSKRHDLKLGICGEHGGDPASVAFCHAVGLHYVSCSPYRVPIARLAAAQAALKADPAEIKKAAA
ncbi:MAG: pyruvate, phosphate dikinase [Alphaproteobacteria bacterium]|nr:pyruvate, phosphate dikinase [Alphaproteobacteria bacterium]